MNGISGSASVPTLLHVFPSFAIGGVPVRIVDVANHLGAEYRHRCIALDGRDDALARVQQGTDFTMVEHDTAVRGLTRIPGLVRRLRVIDADILCTYNWGAVEWALAASFEMPERHIHFESGFGAEEAQRPLLRRSTFRRLALRNCARLVVPSRTLESLARRRRWALPDRIARIPNGVDIHRFRPDGGKRSEPPLKVVTVCPVRREKRLDRLIDIFGRLSCEFDGSAELVIYGDGPERHALEASIAHRRGPSAPKFAGHVTDVRAVLDAAAVFAMTSETEQMPNALLQAMAMGLPAIAFSAGDIEDILPPRQAEFIYEQGDAEGFAAGLRRLLTDPDLRQELGAANRSRACQRFSLEAMVAAYRRLYEDVLTGR